MFLVEDSIYSYWGSVNQWHNARYVLRKYITKSANLKHPITINSANQTEHFTGTVEIDADAWVEDNLSILAFVQRLDGCCTEPVFQVHRWKVNDLDPDPDGDGLTYLYDNCHYAYNPEQEDAEESLPVDYDGPELEIGFNVGYLQDVLNVVRGSQVKLTVNDANSSALIEDPEAEQALYVIMPMKL